MPGKINWKKLRAEELTTELLEEVLEEIPSDQDSAASDTEDEEEDAPENCIPPATEAMTQLLTSAPDPEIESDEEEATGQNNDTVVWEKQIPIPTQIGVFAMPSGHNISEEIGFPVDIFHCLYTKELIDHLVYQTNLYATQKQGGSIHFQVTDAKEMKIFLAINILMGIKKLPSYKDYWSSDPALRDSYISLLMSRNRFAWLLSHLHVNDNSLQPPRGMQIMINSSKFVPYWTTCPNLSKSPISHQKYNLWTNQ